MILLPMMAVVTLSTGQSCPYSSATVDSVGNAVYNCGGVSPAPTPTPAPTPAPTPTPAPVVPSGCKVGTLPAKGGNQNVVDGTNGATIYSWPLSFYNGEGNIQFASYTSLSPSSMKVEVSISPTPCDTNYGASHVAMFGLKPCIAMGSGEAVNLSWAKTESYYQCGAKDGWYVNWRILEGSCNRAEACGQTFYWY